MTFSLPSSSSFAEAQFNISDLKQRRRRCQGRRLEKSEFIFFCRILHMPRSVQYVYRSQNLPKPICNASVQFQKKIRKISRRRSRSPKYLEIGHFSLSFYRGRLRNVPRIITHVHSHCSAHQTFCFVAFSLPLPSWFA